MYSRQFECKSTPGPAVQRILLEVKENIDDFESSETNLLKDLSVGLLLFNLTVTPTSAEIGALCMSLYTIFEQLVKSLTFGGERRHGQRAHIVN